MIPLKTVSFAQVQNLKAGDLVCLQAPADSIFIIGVTVDNVRLAVQVDAPDRDVIEVSEAFGHAVLINNYEIEIDPASLVTSSAGRKPGTLIVAPAGLSILGRFGVNLYDLAIGRDDYSTNDLTLRFQKWQIVQNTNTGKNVICTIDANGTSPSA